MCHEYIITRAAQNQPPVITMGISLIHDLIWCHIDVSSDHEIKWLQLTEAGAAAPLH